MKLKHVMHDAGPCVITPDEMGGGSHRPFIMLMQKRPTRVGKAGRHHAPVTRNHLCMREFVHELLFSCTLVTDRSNHAFVCIAASKDIDPAMHACERCTTTEYRDVRAYHDGEMDANENDGCCTTVRQRLGVAAKVAVYVGTMHASNKASAPTNSFRKFRRVRRSRFLLLQKYIN